MSYMSVEEQIGAILSPEETLDGTLSAEEGLDGTLSTDGSAGLSARLMEADRPPGGEGTYDYEDLVNKPRIEGVELVGNRTFPQLKLSPIDPLDIYSILRGD